MSFLAHGPRSGADRSEFLLRLRALGEEAVERLGKLKDEGLATDFNCEVYPLQDTARTVFPSVFSNLKKDP